MSVNQEDNKERAARALRVIKHYCEMIEIPVDAAENIRCTIIDILSDLQHYCAQTGVEFDHVLQMAEMHFEEETEEEIDFDDEDVDLDDEELEPSEK